MQRCNWFFSKAMCCLFCLSLLAISLPGSNKLKPALSCRGAINVRIGNNCETELAIQTVLLGDFNEVDLSTYQIMVKDGIENGPIINGCGSYEYVVTGPNGFSCGGRVVAEDKSPPVLICPQPILPNEAEDEASSALVCGDLHAILLSEEMTYTTDMQGGLVSIPESLKAILDITGYPTVSDNCGDIQIKVSDLVSYPDERCEEILIQRSFSAVDGCEALVASCVQQIYLGIPTINAVIPPNAEVERSCSNDIKLDAHGNPHPDETGYPQLKTSIQSYDLKEAFCTIGASYRDGERIILCGGSYKIVRTWQILDWCQPKDPLEFSQIIILTDELKPSVSCPEIDVDEDGISDPLQFSTGPYDCTAAFEVPMPQVNEACSEWTVLTEILIGGIGGSVSALIGPDQSRYISGIPIGCHAFRYTVTDGCGNEEIKTCSFWVEDLIAPIAICNDDLSVSIGGGGYVQIEASEVAQGSSDNCGPILLEVRRRIKDINAYQSCLSLFDIDGNGVVLNDEVRLSNEFGDPDNDGIPGDIFYYTDWKEFVEFTCCDLDENVRIELRVWDDRNGNGYAGDRAEVDYCGEEGTRVVEDNFNVCWLDVSVEDKIKPVCIAPPSTSITCDRLPENFDPQIEEQMFLLFGTALGVDNCSDGVIQELEAITDDLNSCKVGTFIRRFRLLDSKGTYSDVCEQEVSIEAANDYWIKFPADTQAHCGIPFPDTIVIGEGHCDLLATSTKEEVFAASDDECYKIFRTYAVINWCEFDGISEPVVVSRDADCDGLPGDEAVYVMVKTILGNNLCSDSETNETVEETRFQQVWYDRDSDPFNLLPAAGIKGKDCDGESNPFGFWKERVPLTENELIGENTDAYPVSYAQDQCEYMKSTGYWQYTQVIKVYDTIQPSLRFAVPQLFCSYSSQFENGCSTLVQIDFTVQENCTTEDISVEVNLDLYQDGVLDGEITDSLSGAYPHYQLSGAYPIGEHFLIIHVRDGCGNQTIDSIPFEVEDCKAPVPVCTDGLSIALAPIIPIQDIDNDGELDAAASTIWANDFIASPSTDCSGAVSFSINKLGETPDSNQSSLTLTCKDDVNTVIQLWAYDSVGNADYCETYIAIQDNSVICDLDGAGGQLAGLITDESGLPIEAVQVELSGEMLNSNLTEKDGLYAFADLEKGFDYTITPKKENGPLEGVSTFDLVLMSKHILGLQILDTPYKLIAADVDNSGSVSILDAIVLRRVLLNIDQDFSNNTSWRFVPATYLFPDPENPWEEIFPEVININELTADRKEEDFIAIKIGDLNGGKQR